MLHRLISFFRPPEPTFGELIDSYRASRSYRDLAPSTQEVYGRVLDHLLTEIGPTLPLSQLTRPRIERHLASRSRGAAVEHLKKLKVVCRHGLAVGLLSSDPTLAIQKPRGVRERHSWTEDEISRFRARWPLGSRPRLVLELALGTAQRRGDLARMMWEDIEGDVIHVTQSKTGRRLRIPITSELRSALDRERARKGPIIRVYGGRPFASPASLGVWFRKQCDAAGLPHCALHGLRKACCRRLAEAGCSAHEIGSISGHLTLSEVSRYTKGAEQERLARRALERLGC